MGFILLCCHVCKKINSIVEDHTACNLLTEVQNEKCTQGKKKTKKKKIQELSFQIDFTYATSAKVRIYK